LEEVITKKQKKQEHNKSIFVEDVHIVDATFLAQPITLRFWSSFFVILPIFFQAPWVRYQPFSALLFTFFLLVVSIFLSSEPSNKFFIIGSLLFGVTGSWLGGSLFWGWLSSHPVLHIPVEAVALPLAFVGLGTKWKIGSSFYLASLFGTAMTDLIILCTGIMDQWTEVVNADPDMAPLILQRTSENLLHFQPLLIIILAGSFLWFVSKKISNMASINSSNGRSLLVSSYVLQTTLVVDGLFILLAIIQPKLSGLV
tara:strand:+ start:3218 stop:3985 length:768 start_codon:yes stop_codon:yes gene_type:complete